MFVQKLMILVIVVVAAVTAVEYVPRAHLEEYAGKSHNLTIGYRKPGDRLILQQNVVKKSAWMRIVSTTMTFNIPKFKQLTMVSAHDRKNDGTGAYCKLVRGGPGYGNVTLKFESQRSHGINFTVYLYAR
ncbi:hypothetical protein V1477_008819 [Vespula maculifrons]|uniref:Salivary secreted peptide n=1 Tax=Vespula maculifrons TaxID=7453 RepID=A0ABD2CE51_VESMC